MTKCCLAVLSLASAFASGSIPAFSAGFDCGYDKLNGTERAICADDELSKLDDYLGMYYENEEKRALTDPEKEDEEALAVLSQHQREWIAKRDECGEDTQCIKQAYFDYFASYDLNFIADKATRIAELGEGEFVFDYAKTEYNGSKLEVVFKSENKNNIRITGSGDRVNNNSQWLVTYVDGKQKQTYPSDPEYGFEFMSIDLQSTEYGTWLNAQIGDLWLRGNGYFLFEMDSSGELNILEEYLIGVSGGALFSEAYDFRTMTYSSTSSMIHLSCEFLELPKLFQKTSENLIPDTEVIYAAIDSDQSDFNWENYQDYSYPRIYNEAIITVRYEPELAINAFGYLVSQGFKPAESALECAKEAKEYLEKEESAN